MKNTYQIITIYEEDHGCEGIPEGEEQMDQVLLRAEDGTEHWVRIPDALLLQRNWNENDWIHWDENKITK
ncbi:MAG: hypothetical protein Q4D37_03730 [Oscillospiraceae bacterium]|nr:hypothetical protein [Oscillospiraceae bacterium]